MTYLTKILFLLLFVLIACERDEILDVDTEYKELLIVQSEINPDVYFPGVRLTKTLPLGVPYDINLSEITDATLYLRVDSIKIIPLHYTQDGVYKPLYNFVVSPGEYYELFGERGIQTFYAKTKIPLHPQIKNILFHSTGYFSEAEVYSHEGECYAALWAVNDGIYRVSSDFFNVSVSENVFIGSYSIVRAGSYPQAYQTSAYDGRRYIQVYSFDVSFAKYFTSKSGNEVIINPYVQGTGSTDWNVEGTNVIGMFIGVSKGSIYPVN